MAIHLLNGNHTAPDQPPEETERVWASLPKSMIAQVDDFHFGNRHKNRSAAIIALIKLGLQSQGWPKAKPDA